MKHLWIIPCLAVMTCSLTSPANAQQSPIQFYSQDVDVLIRLQSPNDIVETIASASERIYPGYSDVVREKLKDGLGQVILNPDLVGVDTSSEWYAGVYTNGKEEPAVIFAIPATDAAAMKDAQGDHIHSYTSGKWVIYSETEDKAKAIEAGSQVDDNLDRRVLSNFTAGYVGVYVNIQHLTEAYSEEIDLAKDKVLENMNSLRYLETDDSVNVNAMVEVMGQMSDAAFQLTEDTKALSIHFTLENDALQYVTAVEFKNDSKTSTFLSQFKNGPLKSLEKLPDGALSYVGIASGIKELSKWGIDITSVYEKAEAKSETKADLLAQLNEITFGELAQGLSITDSPSNILRSWGIMEASPLDKFVKYSRESVSYVSSVDTTPNADQVYDILTEVDDYNGVSGDRIRVTQTFDPATDPMGIQTLIMNIMVGGDTTESRVVYKDNAQFTVTGSKEDMQALLDRSSGTSASNIASTIRKTYSGDLFFISLADYATGLSRLLKVAAQQPGLPLPLNVEAIDDLKIQPSYASSAVTLEPNMVLMESRIPVTQMEGIGKIVKYVQTLAPPRF